jgi:hypothetical protein
MERSEFRPDPERLMQANMRKDSIIEDLKKENFQLRRENTELKRIIKHSLSYLRYDIPEEVDLSVGDSVPSSWAMKAEKFDTIRRMVLEVTLTLCKQFGRDVSYKEIVEAFSQRYTQAYRGMGNDPAGTIARRVRELAEPKFGEWLISIHEGKWFPGPGAGKQLKAVPEQEKEVEATQ